MCCTELCTKHGSGARFSGDVKTTDSMMNHSEILARAGSLDGAFPFGVSYGDKELQRKKKRETKRANKVSHLCQQLYQNKPLFGCGGRRI